MLSKQVRVLKEDLLHLWSLKAQLSREHHLGGHLDHNLILSYVLCCHHPWVLRIALAKHHRVLQLGVCHSVLITPFKESFEFFLRGRICSFFKIVDLTLRFRLVDALKGVEEAQKRKFDLAVHFIY